MNHLDKLKESIDSLKAVVLKNNSGADFSGDPDSALQGADANISELNDLAAEEGLESTTNPHNPKYTPKPSRQPSLFEAARALKSLSAQIKKDLKESMKVTEKVPEEHTESMKKLLEYVNKETKDRKVKKPSSKKTKDIRKAIDELNSLLDVVKSDLIMTPERLAEEWSAQSRDAITSGAGNAGLENAEAHGEETDGLMGQEDQAQNIDN